MLMCSYANLQIKQLLAHFNASQFLCCSRISNVVTVGSDASKSYYGRDNIEQRFSE